MSFFVCPLSVTGRSEASLVQSLHSGGWYPRRKALHPKPEMNNEEAAKVRVCNGDKAPNTATVQFPSGRSHHCTVLSPDSGGKDAPVSSTTSTTRELTLVHISDTHGVHYKAEELPPGDILVLSGDFLNHGVRDGLGPLIRFGDYFRSLPYEYKVLVMGNHEDGCDSFGVEQLRGLLGFTAPRPRRTLSSDGDAGVKEEEPFADESNAPSSALKDDGGYDEAVYDEPAGHHQHNHRHRHGKRRPSIGSSGTCVGHSVLLLDQYVVIQGLLFYGTPWTAPKEDDSWTAPLEKRRELFSLIPSDTDILVSHIPPHGVLDYAWKKKLKAYVVRGCPALKAEIEAKHIPLHCFGHVHHEVGVVVESKCSVQQRQQTAHQHPEGEQPHSVAVGKASFTSVASGSGEEVGVEEGDGDITTVPTHWTTTYSNAAMKIFRRPNVFRLVIPSTYPCFDMLTPTSTRHQDGNGSAPCSS